MTDIGETDGVARTFGISRNSVSQIKTRIDKRIVSVGANSYAAPDAQAPTMWKEEDEHGDENEAVG